MDILYLLVPLSVVFVFLIGALFWWALRSGQFDDLEGPGFKVLLDDDMPQRDISTADAATSHAEERDGAFDLRQKEKDPCGYDASAIAAPFHSPPESMQKQRGSVDERDKRNV
jgi:cbb3-type cytochrome oxidase maturation protein